MMRIGLIVISMSLVLAPGPVLTAEGSDIDVDFRLEAGYDSNPLKLPAGERSGLFGAASVDLEYSREFSSRFAWLAELDASLARYEGSTSLADTERGSVLTAFEFTPYRRGRRRVVIETGARYLARRSTFTSRGSGDLFRVVVDPAAVPVVSVPIPDRFDSDTVEGFVDASWSLNAVTKLFVDTAVSSRDYRQDYAAIPGVRSLDYRALEIEPGVAFRLGSGRELTLSASRVSRAYDSRPALDATGQEVAGTTREYDYTEVGLSFEFEPSRRWDVEIGVEAVDRRDAYAGYYDYSGLELNARGRFTADDKTVLSVRAALRDRDYDSATVSNEIDGEIRSNETVELAARLERSLTGPLRITAELSYRDADSRNPLYSYSREQLTVGLRYRR